jgi:glycosyltransferase 2 family protein
MASGKRGVLLRYGISATVTCLFLYLAFRGTDFGKLWGTLLRVNYWWMIPNFACLLLSHFLRAWRWRYMLEPVRPNLPMRSLFSGVMVGYMVNNVLPRAGEIVRPYTIGKLEGISKSAAFGTIVVERIIDMVSFLTLVVLIPLVYQGPLMESFPWLVHTAVIVLVVTILFMGIFVVLALRRDLTDKIIGWLERVLPRKISGRVEDWAHLFLDGFLFLGRPGRFAVIAILSILIWFLYIMMLYVAFFAFDLQHLGFSCALVVEAISSIGVALPAPGGTGTYHAFTAQTLSRLYGIDGTLALSYATITHAVGYIGVTIIGLYYFLRDHISVGEAVHDESRRKV